MVQVAQLLPGSDSVIDPRMLRVGDVPGEKLITISLYLKAHTPPPSEYHLAGQSFEDRDAMCRRREREYHSEFAAVSDFAHGAGLRVLATDAARLKVTIQGTAAAFGRAFGTSLHIYRSGADIFVGREGSLCLPVSLVNIVAAVLGLETTPIAESHGDRTKQDPDGVVSRSEPDGLQAQRIEHDGQR